MTREFKVDITLAAELAQFLEGLLVAEFNEEFDAEEACTDTFLDQFMPNGIVPHADLVAAIMRAGIVTEVPCKHERVFEAVRHTTGMSIYRCKDCHKLV